MPAGDLSRARAKREIAAVEAKLKDGYPAKSPQGKTNTQSAATAAAQQLGENRKSLIGRIGTPDRPGTWKTLYGLEPDWSLALKTPEAIKKAKDAKLFAPFLMEHKAPPIGSTEGPRWQLTSDKDNKFRFAAFGDLHAASKYARYDVREDLTRRAEDFGAQCIFDTGNWIDGEAPFNKYDLETIGLDSQCHMLAKNYPKTDLPTYAVAGKDHEGWYSAKEGVDVGRYCESIMREYGHKWTNLGFMEADIQLKNANSGKTAILRDMHPGGGSSYALSYRPQKIIESFEGGEKPAILLMGHYHKLDAGHVRNVFYVQSGCGQDQTPFMRQKAIEAQVGGVLVECEQDPKTGAIIEFTPRLRRYFNRAYYFTEGKANNRWSGHGPISPIPKRANQA